MLGIAGMSLSLAGGASASTGGSAADMPSQNTSPRHEIFLGEEEISDVSLSTFYVFDKENAATPQRGEKLAWRGCGGCRGCGEAAAVAMRLAEAAQVAAAAAAAVASWGGCRAC